MRFKWNEKKAGIYIHKLFLRDGKQFVFEMTKKRVSPFSQDRKLYKEILTNAYNQN
jgi:hypothetical protein